MSMEEKGRRITLTGDISDFKKKFSEANRITKESAKELRAFNKSLKFDTKNFDLLSGKMKEFQLQLGASYTKVKSLREQFNVYSQKGMIAEAEKINKLLIREESNFKQLTNVVKQLKNEINNLKLTKEFEKLDTELNKSKEHLQKFEETLKIDPKNITIMSLKLSEMGKILTTLEEKGKLLKKELSTVSVKSNPDSFKNITTELIKIESETKKVKSEMQSLARAKFSNLNVSLDEVNKDLEQTKINITNLSNAMKGVKFDKTLNNLKLSELRKESDLTKEKVKLLKQELKHIDTKINVSEFAKLKSEIVSSEQHVKKLNSEMKALSFQNITRGLSSVSGGISSMGDKLTSIGKKYALTYSLPIAYANKKLVDNFVETDDSIRSVAVAASDGISSNFTRAYEQVYESAKKSSDGTIYSMKQVADGSEALIKAGWDLKDSQEQVAHVMNLAKIEGMDLASATTIVTDGLSAFGLSANETERFVDALNIASVKSTTGISEMGETFKYVGAIAGTLGFTVEDTALAVALMANKGIKASQAGTSLRAGLTNLVKPSKQARAALADIGFSITDTSGKMKPLAQIISELREKTEGMTEAQKVNFATTVFGKTAMTGWAAILNASDSSVKQLTKDIQSGNHTTREMANQLSSGVGGSIDRFRATVSNTSAELGKNLAPTLTTLIDYSTKLVRGFSQLSPTTQTLITGFVAFTAIIPVLSFGLGSVINGFSRFHKGLSLVFKLLTGATGLLGKTTQGVGLLSSAIGFLTSPIGLAVVGITALVGGLIYYNNNLSESAKAHKKFLTNMDTFGNKMSDVSSKVTNFNDGINQTSGYFSKLYGNTDQVAERFQSLTNSIGSVQQEIDSIVQSHEGNREQWTNAEIQAYNRLTQTLEGMTDEQVKITQQRLTSLNQSIDGFVQANGLTTEHFKTITQDFVKSLDEERSKGYESNKTWYERELRLNQQKPETERQSTDAITQEFERRNKIIDEKESDGINKLLEKITQRDGLNQEFFGKIKGLNESLQTEEQRHANVMDAIESGMYESELEKKAVLLMEEQKYKENKEAIQGQLKEIAEKTSSDDLAMWFSLIQHQIENGGKLTQGQAEFAKNFISTMDNLPDDVKQKFDDAMKKANININDWKPKIEESMRQSGQGSVNKLSEGINSEKDKPVQNVKSIMDNSRKTVDNTNLTPEGKKVGSSIATGIQDSNGVVHDKIEYVMTSAHNTASSKDFTGVGEGITSGISNGISNGWNWLNNQVSNLASSLLSSAKHALGVNSPSRKFRDLIGQHIPTGIAVGIEKTKSAAINSIKSLSEDMLKASADFSISDDVSASVTSDMVVNHQIESNSKIIGTLNNVISTLNSMNMNPVINMDGEKVGEITYKYQQQIERRLSY